jgi:cytochrome c oxidase subunit 4
MSANAEPAHFTPKTYVWIFVWLLILLAATVAIAKVNLGVINVFAAMGIATIKAILVVMYFMQVKRSIKMIQIYAGAAVVWLIIGLVLSFSDYLTRVPFR